MLVRTASVVLLCALAAAPAVSAASKPEYERRMQARMALFTPQCFSDDPATAMRERIARSQRAVRELEAITPPEEVAQAHRRYTEGERLTLATLRKFLPDSQRLSQMIRRANADGKLDEKEQSRIAQENQRLLIRSLPPRRVSELQSSALRTFRAKHYDVQQKGPPKRDYERRVQALIDRAGNPATSVRKTTSAAALRAQILRMRSAMRSATRGLGQITPRPNVLNAQNKLVGGLCERLRLLAGYDQTLKTKTDGRTVKIVLSVLRDIDRVSPVYTIAFKDYRQAGYKLRPAR